MAAARLVAQAFRADQGRAVASLLRAFGDLDLAEDCVQEAYVEALRTWPTRPPDNPGAWIQTTARNRAIDRLRRAGRLERKVEEMAVELDRRQTARDGVAIAETVADDRLRLLFTCCHPALAIEAQVGLTLRLVVGLTTGQIARALLVSEPTMAARLTRAKKRVRDAGVGLRMPDDHELGDRTAAVLRVVYLVFNQGYARRDGGPLLDVELTREAIRLGRLLHRLMPEDPEVAGLLALLLLADARRDARTRSGRLVRLEDQDRSRWDAAAIEEGCALVERALRRGRPGPYQLQAAIQAVHTEAPRAADTDWAEIAGLYEVLAALDPSPVVALNRAVAVHRAEGPGAALALLAPLAEPLGTYHLLHAVTAEVLADLDRTAEAAAALRRAAELTDNPVEQRHLADRLATLTGER